MFMPRLFPVIDISATGKNIKRLLLVQKKKVNELQFYLGFTAPQSIYAWMKGKSLPSTDNLLALTLFFQTPVEQILVYRFINLDEPQEATCGSGHLSGGSFFLPKSGFTSFVGPDQRPFRPECYGYSFLIRPGFAYVSVHPHRAPCIERDQ